MVTVTDPRTHKPVEGATINAHVSNDFSYVSGDQTLCAMNQDGTKRLGCGTSLVGSNFGFQTDDDGHVYLRYWAPGVIEPASTTLSVLARTSCSAKACPAREMVGTAQTTLRVSPYLIYAHTGGLSKDEADDLVEWAGGGNKFTRYLEKANQGLTVLNLAIKWLEHQQVLEEATLKKLLLLEEAEPVAWVVDVINILTALGERHAMVVEFLYATDLSDVGLGDNPSESSVESLIGAQFSDFLVNQGVALPFHYGVAGAWWDLANTLRQVAAPNHGPISVNHKSVPHDDIDFSDWGVKLKVYEVSTCDPAKGYCEPGYANDPGTSVVLRVGIQPDLCFPVVLTYNGYYYDSYGFVTPYDAIAWTENQWDLRGLLKA